MKKKYSLDYSIERDTDRLHAVEEILDTLETNPTPSELEQMASYILYGKDAEICLEFRQMIQQIELGNSMEQVFLEFGKRSDVEDIRQLYQSDIGWLRYLPVTENIKSF